MSHQYVARIFPTDLRPPRPRKATPSPTAMSGAGPQVIDAIKEKRSGSADLAQIASRRTERPVPQSAEA